MDAELKIVGAIVIVVMFLANTGIGIWIYRIMKVAEVFKEEFPVVKAKIEALEKDFIKVKNDITNVEKAISKIESDKADKHKLETLEGRFDDLKTLVEKMQETQANNTNRFIKISEGFGKGITELNSAMGHISESLKEVKDNVKTINDFIFFEKNKK